MNFLKSSKFPFLEALALMAVLLLGDLINFAIYEKVALLNIYYFIPIVAGYFLNHKKMFLWIFLGLLTVWSRERSKDSVFFVRLFLKSISLCFKAS
jgi:hypothetical protein